MGTDGVQLPAVYVESIGKEEMLADSWPENFRRKSCVEYLETVHFICSATEVMIYMFLSVVEDNSQVTAIKSACQMDEQSFYLVRLIADFRPVSSARGLPVALMMEAVSTSEALVNFYQTISQKTAIIILAALRI
jgi:hypothetical protein